MKYKDLYDKLNKHVFACNFQNEELKKELSDLCIISKSGDFLLRGISNLRIFRSVLINNKIVKLESKDIVDGLIVNDFYSLIYYNGKYYLLNMAMTIHDSGFIIRNDNILFLKSERKNVK
jgi:hypothetical protein